MKILGLFTLLSVPLSSFALQESTVSDSSHTTKPSIPFTERFSIQSSTTATTHNYSLDIQAASTASSLIRPIINSEHAAKDCSSWINPTEHPENPSAFTKIPAVISISNIAPNESISLAIVDKYGEQLACFKATALYPTSGISIFIGKCGDTEPIFQGGWPDLTEPHSDYWSCLAKPIQAVSNYFHIEISAKELNDESLRVSFSPNGYMKKAVSVTVSSSAEFIYIFATKIKTAVNVVYFHNGYTASKCQTLDEPVKWDEVAYFLPDSEPKDVTIYISYCHFTEVLHYSVNHKNYHWHKLCFSENPSVESRENIFFYRNILVDDVIIGNITTTFDYPPLLLRLMRVCPLKEARVSISNAIWTSKCPLTDILNKNLPFNGTSNFKCLDADESCKNLTSNSSETFQSIPFSFIDTNNVAQDCSYLTSQEEFSAGQFVKIPSVVSLYGISDNESFSVVILDRYLNQLACLEGIVHQQGLHMAIFSGNCKNGILIAEDIWSPMIQPDKDNWQCLVKPHFSLSNHFHLEIAKENIGNGTSKTEVSFRPNGKSEKKLSAIVHSSAEFGYIFGNEIKTGMNLVYYLDGYIASKCQTLDEPVDWNDPAYFLPFETETLVRIYISFCHFTETVDYAIGSTQPKWHMMTFIEDPEISEMDNIFFHRKISIDGLIIGNITTTMEHPPVLLRLMEMCPLKEARISMTNAVWMHKCSPDNMN